MKIPAAILFATLWLPLAASAAASTAPERQDPAALRQSAEQFLRTQTAGLPGEVELTVGPVDARTVLPACAALQPFLPNGSRAWGKTTVGLRCTAPSRWTIYVSAHVRIMGEYVVTAAPLSQGQVLGLQDLATIRGDLTSMPAGIVTQPEQAVGRTVAISLSPGTPLRNDALRSVQVIQQGQNVRVESVGPGFRVSAEAKALNNAAEGQIAQARTASGQVVSGVARPGGIVEVSY